MIEYKFDSLSGKCTELQISNTTKLLQSIGNRKNITLHSKRIRSLDSMNKYSTEIKIEQFRDFFARIRPFFRKNNRKTYILHIHMYSDM